MSYATLVNAAIFGWRYLGSDISITGTLLSAHQPIGSSELELQRCPHDQAKQKASEHRSTVISTTPDEICNECINRPFYVL
jgi:hypothetical protein